MAPTTKARSLFDPAIVKQAIIDAFSKLTPRHQVRNPVMFVVEVGSVLTTLALHPGARRQGRGARRVHPRGLGLALVHGALRQLRRGDGRGARQGPGRLAAEGAPRHPGEAARRGADRDAAVRDRLRRRRSGRATSSSSRPATSSRCDGEVVEGVASVNESADHRRERARHPRERRRPQRGHRRHARAVRLAHRRGHREPGRSVPRPHDRDGRRRQAPEDAERDRARHPARGADDHLPARDASRCCRSRSTA